MKYLVLLFVIFTVRFVSAADRPEIKGQLPLQVDQGGSITLQLSDLIVDANKSDYPTGYYLEVLNGDNYTYSGRTVTPSPSFSGELRVHVRVTNGTTDSKKYKLKINVIAKQQQTGNTPPKIVGQLPVTGERGRPIQISLSQLLVVDPDNRYPQDFRLTILPGAFYTVDGNKVIAAADAPDVLTIYVTVNDGNSDSEKFGVKIVLQQQRKNEKPVITGQVDLSTTMNQPLTIQLTHLTVTDPDNAYPGDFKLFVSPGQNYTVNGTTITPAPGFAGTLTVNVKVNDGRNDSDFFPLKIAVTQQNALRIVGQKDLQVLEDSSLTLVLTDLIVNDPNDRFPNGFTLAILPGDNYTFNQLTIKPAKNFYGTLKVKVQLTGGNQTLPAYPLSITVVPVNDPPELNWDPSAIRYNKDKAPLAIATDAIVIDADDQTLQSAEIGFSFDSYQKGNDVLSFQTGNSLSLVSNAAQGVYYLVGNAPLSDYQQAIRSITYQFKTLGDTLPLFDTKLIYIKLFDGRLYSDSKEREIVMLEDIPLDIPTGFTPNNDNANDTWYIKPLSNSTALENAVVRVFTKHGVKVFETTGFDKAWDGKLDGQLLPADSYFYTIEIKGAFRRINKSGVVTLLR